MESIQKTLGIDLGSNSLGWALVDDNQILKTGVILFDEGIIREKGNDSLNTPAGERTQYRLARRMKMRRRLRKYHTLKSLIENQMCPLPLEKLKSWVIKKEKYPIDNLEFQDWLKTHGDHNPYYFRAKAAEERISKLEQGRAFFHLAQRRGFLSSRKGKTGSEKAEKEELGLKGDIQRLTAILTEKNQTLGQYFYSILKNNQTTLDEKQRIRTQHTGRKEHYIKEFEKICEVQNIDPSLKDTLYKAIFMQRPLRSQKHLVGNCELEPNRPRCLIAHPRFEEYRMLSFINNIRIGVEKRPLTQAEIEQIKPCFFRKSSAYFKFEDIVKALYPKYKKGKENVDVPKFNYRFDTSITGSQTSAQFKALLGDNWETFSHEYLRDQSSKKQKHNINDKGYVTLQSIFDALYFFEDKDKLKIFAIKRMGLDDKTAADFSEKFKLKDGYANISLHAINKILPFLRQGYELTTAKILAKLPDVLADRWETQGEQIVAEISQIIQHWRTIKSTKDIQKETLKKRLTRHFKDFLKLDDNSIDKLYWHEEQNPYANAKGDVLPIVDLGMIRNPLVQRSLTTLRKFINYLKSQGDIDESTYIHIELAREVNDRNTRMAYQEYQKELEKERQNAISKLEEEHLPINEDMIERYLLWLEQNGKCIYSNQAIGIHSLASGDEFNIEHTIPVSRSGDNSRANKTLCHRKANQIKNNRLPSELENYEEIKGLLRPWFEKLEHLEETYANEKAIAKKISSDDKERRSSARQRMLTTKMKLEYWRKKIKTFTVTKEEWEERENRFRNSQLVDTGVMTSHALKLLRSVYPNTYAVNGSAVAWARKAWGLQSQYEKKERVDHTHHAIDAIVIAYLNRWRFNTICESFRNDQEFAHAERKLVPAPFWETSNVVYNAIDTILVRNITRHNELKQTKRKRVHLVTPTNDGRKIVPSSGDTIRGQLHKESFYGCIQLPPNHTDKEDGKNVFVVTKPLNENFEEKMIDKIVDLAVRETVRAQFNTYKNNDVPLKKIFAQPFWMNKEKGIRIKKVRIIDRVTSPNEIKTHSHLSKHDYKNPYYTVTARESNFMMGIYKTVDKKGEMIYKTNVVNLLDCIKDDYVAPQYRTDLGEFIGIIQPGTLALAYDRSPTELYPMSSKELSKRLYTVVKYAEGQSTTLDYHRDAQKEKGTGKSTIDLQYPKRVLISNSKMLNSFLFEGIHFTMTQDGRIEFIKKED